jgi:uncharacterized protein YbjT (DUF2867 family)
MKIRAIVFGATGMVGEGVLHESLNNDAVESVLVIGRRPCNVIHPKLTELIHNDFFHYATIEQSMSGYNACYFCLGVTSVGKNEDEYRRLTYDLTMAAATTVARLNPDLVFCYVSGVGTDSTERGRSMWARVKGKTENDLMKLPFRAMYAFRPGLIRPMAGARNSLLFAKLLAPLFPIMKLFAAKYICTLEDIGRSMIRVSTHGYEKNVLDCEEITSLAKKHTQTSH